jgi:plastocyanin
MRPNPKPAARLLATVAVVALAASLTVVLGAAPARAGGGGCHRDMQWGPLEGTGATVELVKACMTPSILRVDPGTAITFVNRDDMLHNIVGSGMFAWDLGLDASVAYRFDHAGTFPYACTLHPGMVGAVVVGDGRRIAADSTSTLPVEVTRGEEAAAGPATTTSTAPAVALAAARRTPATAAGDDGDGDGLPLVPAAVALAAVGAVAYVAGRRRTPTVMER